MKLSKFFKAPKTLKTPKKPRSNPFGVDKRTRGGKKLWWMPGRTTKR